MKALHKDIFREIIKTKSKFISIIIIMFLGTFVFVGLEETPPTMKKTVNEYFKNVNMYDLKISNEFALTKEDLQVIKSQNNIKLSEEYYIKTIKDKNSNNNLELISLPENIAIPILKLGNLPTNEDEIVLTESLIDNYKIGDIFDIDYKEESNIKLKRTKFKVVGFVYGVDYPENSTNNKANTNYFAYIKKDNFQSDVVSGINIILENSYRENFTSENYYNFVNDIRLDFIKILENEQVKNNKNFQETNIKTFNESKNQLSEYNENLKNQEQLLNSQKESLPTNIYNEATKEIEKNKEELNKKEKLLLKNKEKLDFLSYPRYNVENIKGNPQYKQFISSSESLKSVANIFSIFLFLIAILVSLTTLTRMIDENRTNIGTLKSLGYTNIEIAQKYIFYGLISTLIGAILGIIGAYKIIVPIIYNSYAKFLTLQIPILSIRVEIICLALLITIFSIFIAIYIPLNKILLEKSAYLLRPKVPKEGARILLEYLPFIWKKISFLRKVTFRNIFRYKIRMIMTIFGILGCLSLMFVGFGIRYSVINITKEQFETVNKYDIIATYNQYLTDEEKLELDNFVKKDTNIKNYAEINISRGTIEKNNEILDNTSIAVLDNKINLTDYFTLKSTDEENLQLSSNGVIINEKLAYLHNLQKGSNLDIVMNDKVYNVEVVGINKNYFGHIIYMNKEYYEKLTNNKFLYNSYLIKANHDKQIAKEITDRLEKNENIVNIQNNLSYQLTLDNFLEGIDIIVVVIVFCSVSLALVVLYNLINVNVSERIRELSTIKVLGFYPREVTTYVFREIFYLGTLGIILGNFLGYQLYKKIILDLAAREMMFEIKASKEVYFVSSAITLFILLIVMIIIHIRLKKVDMVESLKSIE